MPRHVTTVENLYTRDMNIRYLFVLAIASLLMSPIAAADVLTFVCVGQESFFPKTQADQEQTITQKSTTVRLELDRQKNTLTLRGTAQADGSGALRTPNGTFATNYAKTLTMFDVAFKHVLISLPQDGNQLVVAASTHARLDAPDSEARVLFMGICRLPVQKG